jgi:hypothetical protein
VESHSDKNLEQRQAKWRNFYQVSGGKIFVVCDSRFRMRNMRSEINYCLGNKPLVVSLTKFADIQTVKRGEDDKIWPEIKKKRTKLFILKYFDRIIGLSEGSSCL